MTNNIALKVILIQQPCCCTCVAIWLLTIWHTFHCLFINTICSTFQTTLSIQHLSIFTTNLAFSLETSNFQNEHCRQILGMKKEQFFSHYITKILIIQASFKDLLMNIQQMHVALGIKCIKHNVLLRHWYITTWIHQYFNIDDYNYTFQPTWKPWKVL